MITILILTHLLAFVVAVKIENIEFSNLTLNPVTQFIEPHQGWEAKFNFHIPESYQVKKDDYFELVLPRVYRIKFAQDSTELIIPMKDRPQTEVFHCTVPQQAAFKYADTIIKCVTLTDLAPHPEIFGEIKFVLSFSNGDSSYEYELKNADHFQSGLNDIEFVEGLNTQVHFNAADFSDHFYTTIRSTSYNTVEIYFLSMKCPNGYILGGTQRMNFGSEDQNCILDCDSPQVFTSNHFNDWWFPKSYKEAKDPDVICFGNNLWITIGEQKEGGLLWVNAMQGVEQGRNQLLHDVYLEYTCTDTIAQTTYSTDHTAVLEYNIYEVSDTAIAEIPVSVPPMTPSSTLPSSITVSTVTSTICPHCTPSLPSASSILSTSSSTETTTSSTTISISSSTTTPNSPIISTSTTVPSNPPTHEIPPPSPPHSTKSSTPATPSWFESLTTSINSTSIPPSSSPSTSIKPSSRTSSSTSFTTTIISTSVPPPNSNFNTTSSYSSSSTTITVPPPLSPSSTPGISTITTTTTIPTTIITSTTKSYTPPPAIESSGTISSLCESCTISSPPVESLPPPFIVTNVPPPANPPSNTDTTSTIITTNPPPDAEITITTTSTTVTTTTPISPTTSKPSLKSLPPFSLQFSSRPPIDTRSSKPPVPSNSILYEGAAAVIGNNIGLITFVALLLIL